MIGSIIVSGYHFNARLKSFIASDNNTIQSNQFSIFRRITWAKSWALRVSKVASCSKVMDAIFKSWVPILGHVRAEDAGTFRRQPNPKAK